MLTRLKSFFCPPQPDPLRAPARIFWTGLILRMLYVTLAHTYRVRPFLDHFQFGWEMGRIARALVTGYGYADPFHGHTGPTAWTPPVYPLMIAAVFKVFGVYTAASAWVIFLVNSIFSSATIFPIYQIARRMFGRDAKGTKIALWSAWLWALYPAAMQYAVHWIWDMALTAFLFTWAIVCALRLRGIGEPDDESQSGVRTWAVWGLLWGLIALSNSSLLSFLPFCGVWILWGTPRPRLAAAIRNATLAAVVFIAVITPWIARNFVALHAFVPMRSNFGAEFYESQRVVNGPFPWGGTLPVAEADSEFQTYKRMGEIAYCRQQGERAKAVLREHPGRFLTYTGYRFDFFWSGVPHATEDTFKSRLVEAGRQFNYCLLTVTGLLGLALALKRCVPGATLVALAFLVCPLLYYFVTVQARFRHPLEPLICILTMYLFQSAEPRKPPGKVQRTP